MEMKIAEPIQTLEYLRDSGVFPFSSKEGVLFTTESIDVAIDTMEKYQKITEIVKSKTTRLSYDIGFRQIKKVVEDGKTD